MCGSIFEFPSHLTLSRPGVDSLNKLVICGRLIDDGGYGLDRVAVAGVLRVTMEGLWLDLLTMTTPYSREEAVSTVYCCTASFFPRIFNSKGLLRDAT
jgi:hypothetical protein